jgi:hypothetical protein
MLRRQLGFEILEVLVKACTILLHLSVCQKVVRLRDLLLVQVRLVVSLKRRRQLVLVSLLKHPLLIFTSISSIASGMLIESLPRVMGWSLLNLLSDEHLLS